jgi:hypothetical protein
MSFAFSLRRDGINQVDFKIERGRIVMCTSADAVRDRIFTALSTQLGEWYLDLEDGVPYTGEGGILGGKLTEAEVSAIIRRRILLDPEVNRIISLQVTQDAARRVRVQAEVSLKLADGTSETINVGV